MKKVTAILGLMLISSTVLAGECVTKNLSQEKERLTTVQGISDAERSLLYKSAENTKELQILACAGFKESISESDSIFAINSINNERALKIAAIKKQEDRLKSLLQDNSINGLEREIYQQSLVFVPKRINQENELADTILKHIKRATR